MEAMGSGTNVSEMAKGSCDAEMGRKGMEMGMSRRSGMVALGFGEADGRCMSLSSCFGDERSPREAVVSRVRRGCSVIPQSWAE